MVNTIIKSNPLEQRIAAEDGTMILNVAECFSDTIQGEGVYVGYPATFLRMQGCTLNCVWCDTQEVWRFGNPYSVNELVEIFDKTGTIEKLRNGQHLILTGGSPLKQQKGLYEFIYQIKNRYGFKPFIQVENEAVLRPTEDFQKEVNVWNNSPKLENSGMHDKLRYREEILRLTASLPNSYFKFVVQDENDWNEIKTKYLDTNIIKKNQIILMPEGVTRDELHNRYESLVDLCTRENVRMTDRLHVTVWNKKTGV